jgi:transcriptional regulator with XRE-family HTH domain
MHIATRLQEAFWGRRPRPWTQLELSEASGVPQSGISDSLKLGDEYQREDYVREMARVLELDYAELIKPPDLVDVLRAEVERAAAENGPPAKRALAAWPAIEETLRRQGGPLDHAAIAHRPPGRGDRRRRSA